MEKLKAQLGTQINDLVALGISCGVEERNADAHVLFEEDRVYFETKGPSGNVRRLVSEEDLNANGLLPIFRAGARFNYHLDLTQVSKGRISSDKIPIPPA
jgi:hypothetical protein